jgi:hypothetical protein
MGMVTKAGRNLDAVLSSSSVEWVALHQGSVGIERFWIQIQISSCPYREGGIGV